MCLEFSPWGIPMRATIVAIVAIVTLALVSCATLTVTVVALQTNFDPSEVAFINEQGTNTVKGSALIRQQGGGVVTCAGNQVMLIPKGTHSVERMGILYGAVTGSGFIQMSGDWFVGMDGDIKKMPPPPEDYLRHSRGVTCDVDGKFEFSNVAVGSYFVTTSVTWTVVGHGSQGGSLMVPVTFTGGDEVKSVILTP